MLSPRLGSGVRLGSRAGYRSASSPAPSRTASPLPAQGGSSSGSGCSAAAVPLSPSVGMPSAGRRGGRDSPQRSPGPHHKPTTGVSKTDVKSKLNVKAGAMPPSHPSSQPDQGSCGPVPQVKPHQSSSDVARRKSHLHH